MTPVGEGCFPTFDKLGIDGLTSDTRRGTWGRSGQVTGSDQLNRRGTSRVYDELCCEVQLVWVNDFGQGAVVLLALRIRVYTVSHLAHGHCALSYRPGEIYWLFSCDDDVNCCGRTVKRTVVRVHNLTASG